MTALPDSVPDLFHWKGWRLLGTLLVALLLLAPAFWNGYPLVYFDSEDYVEMSFTWQPIIYRIMTYGAFTTVARPFGTLWAVVWVQAIMMAWLLHEAVWAWIARWRPHVYLLLSVALVCFTGLAWVTSEILADMFAGAAVLGVMILAFGDALPLWRRVLLIPLVAIAICVHMSHVAVCAGLVLVILFLWAISRLHLRLPRPRVRLAVLAVGAGIALVPSVHFMATGRPVFSESGQVLQLALFVQNGLAKKYLDEICPQGVPFKMCDYKDDLPYTADEFLWGESPFEEMGGWAAMKPEAAAIVRGAAKMFPGDLAHAMLDDTLRQFELIAVGEDLVPMSWHFVKTQLKYYPHDFRSFRFARQQRHEGIDFQPLNKLQVPITEAAEIAMLGLLFVAWRRRDRISGGILILTLMALLGNAFVCGALSNPHDRYQNRVSWLALMGSIICAVRLDQRFTRRRPLSEMEKQAVIEIRLPHKP